MPKTVFPIRRNPAGKRMVKAFFIYTKWHDYYGIMPDIAKA